MFMDNGWVGYGPRPGDYSNLCQFSSEQAKAETDVRHAASEGNETTTREAIERIGG